VPRVRRRDAFIAAAPGGITVVADREADTQDVDTLASLALTPAAKLSAPALAVLNHDDDALLLALYDANGLVMEHGWSNGPAFDVPRTDRSAFVAIVRERFAGRNLLLQILTFMFGRFFAIDRHSAWFKKRGCRIFRSAQATTMSPGAMSKGRRGRSRAFSRGAPAPFDSPYSGATHEKSR